MAAQTAPAPSPAQVAGPRLSRRRSRPPWIATATRSRPPRMILAAPTETGVASAGAKVRAVPVVPHRDAASRMYAPPPAPRAGSAPPSGAEPADDGEDGEDDEEDEEDEEDEDDGKDTRQRS